MNFLFLFDSHGAGSSGSMEPALLYCTSQLPIKNNRGRVVGVAWDSSLRQALLPPTFRAGPAPCLPPGHSVTRAKPSSHIWSITATCNTGGLWPAVLALALALPPPPFRLPAPTLTPTLQGHFPHPHLGGQQGQSPVSTPHPNSALTLFSCTAPVALGPTPAVWGHSPCFPLTAVAPTPAPLTLPPPPFPLFPILPQGWAWPPTHSTAVVGPRLSHLYPPLWGQTRPGVSPTPTDLPAILWGWAPPPHWPGSAAFQPPCWEGAAGEREGARPAARMV